MKIIHGMVASEDYKTGADIVAKGCMFKSVPLTLLGVAAIAGGIYCIGRSSFIGGVNAFEQGEYKALKKIDAIE